MTKSNSILTSQSIATVRRHLDSVGYISVLHWHLAGASHPTPLAFSDFDTFWQYLTESTKAGDAIDVWPFPSENTERIAEGKIPKSDGTVHKSGSY